MIPWFVRGYILKHFRQLELPPQRCTKVCTCSARNEKNVKNEMLNVCVKPGKHCMSSFCPLQVGLLSLVLHASVAMQHGIWILCDVASWTIARTMSTVAMFHLQD